MNLDKNHIIYTLGINVPTLTESLNGDKNAIQLILKEQILYEGFLDSIKQYAGDKWNKAITTVKDWKDIASYLGKTISSGNIDKFISPLIRYGINQPLKTLKTLLDKLKLSNFYKDYVLPTIKKIGNLKGWKGFVVILSIGSIVKYIITKLTNISAENMKKWILAYFSDDILDTILGKLTNFASFLGWIKPIVKGVEIIFDLLSQSISRISYYDDILKKISAKPITENRIKTSNLNENKMKNESLKKLIKEEIKNILKEEDTKPEAEDKKSQTIQTIQKYFEGPGKTPLSLIKNPMDLKNILTLIWNGMNENFRDNNAIATSLKKVIDTKLK